MIQNRYGDRGQAFPIYIVMVASLLFLAFAFFTVGKASAVRNGAQGAADAAALAAAQEARSEMGTGFLAALLLPGGLEDFFDDNKFFDPGPCAAARELAAKNRADVTPIDGTGRGCFSVPGFLRDEITVDVKTRYTVGKSVIPGTEQRHATARATAVVEFRCSLPEPEPEGSASPGGDTDGGTDDGKEEDDKPGPIDFNCHGGDHINIDPTDPGSWESLSKILFTVHLVDAD
ncbi:MULTISPECIES: pilus assembly protein TadG-related protein [unclassified Streptomyces]|uniref:pilus assembly protein TadG-related protein n=1 Tax=unclassified Streptomyces TaxID=2593676 RepID=UPI003830F67A